MPDEDPPREDTSKEIEKAVKDRVEKESRSYPKPDPKSNGKLNSRFVRQCLKANELGDGLLYTSLMRDQFLYNNTMDEWFAWGGHSWHRDVMKRALAATEEVVDRLLEELDQVGKEIAWNIEKGDVKVVQRLTNLRETIHKRISRFRTDKGRNACLKFARTNKEPLAIEGGEFDQAPWLLACKNGVIDLRIGKHRTGRPQDLLYLTSPTEWQGLDTPAVAWERFILEIMDQEEELVAYIQRLLGYGVTGFNIEHILPVLCGKGRNGKGKMVEVLNHVMGPLAGSIQSELLLDQKRPRSSAGPSPDIMGLKGLRLAFASETDEGQRFSAAKVKWLTGGDQLVGRYPHDKYEIRFIPTHTLFLLTNDKPQAPMQDFAFWERVHLVPFRLSFVDREPSDSTERRADKHLAEKLKKEASGILAWLVRGCLEYQKRGLDPPKAVLEATAQYRRDEDLLGEFLEDQCMRIDTLRGQASELYDRFLAYYKANVTKKGSFSQRRFGTLMGKLFEKQKIEGVIYYLGVDVDPTVPPPEEA